MSDQLGRRIGKREPFDSKEDAALLNLLRTADRVQSRVARLLREYGLTPAQYNVLRILRGLGEPTPILGIAERMLTETPGITGLIDRLEKMGLVRRQRCDEDRRVVYVVIEAKAVDLLKRLESPLAELRAQVLAGTTPAELGTLIRILDKIREPLEGP